MEEESRKKSFLASISKVRLYVYLGLGILIAVALSPLFSGHPGISKPTPSTQSVVSRSNVPKKSLKVSDTPLGAYFTILVVEDKFYIDNAEVSSTQAAAMALASKLPIEIQYAFSARTIAEEEIIAALSALDLEIDRVTKLPEPTENNPKN